MFINANTLPETKPSFLFSKIKDSTIVNTDITHLPEEKVPLAIIPAVEKLIKPKKQKAEEGVVNIHEMHAENVSNTRVNTSSANVIKPKFILQNANKTVKEELDEIAEILQNAMFLAHAENTFLGNIKAPEFNELRALNIITSSMITNFSHSTIGELISQKNKAEAKLESIKLFCEGKNLKPKGLNIIYDCTRKVVVLKGKEECNNLANENSIHEKTFQKHYHTKKGYSR